MHIMPNERFMRISSVGVCCYNWYTFTVIIVMSATLFASKSIADLIAELDAINNTTMMGGIVMDIEQLDSNIDHIHEMIRYMQSVCHTASQVANQISKLRKFRANQAKPSTVEVRPMAEDAAVIRLNGHHTLVTCVESLPQVSLPVVRVDSRAQIPIQPLYYISSEKQFATNIAGCLIAGSIGSIAERGHLRTATCQYRQECTALLSGKPCEYWHPPQDFMDVGRVVPDKHWRNFTTGQFLHAKRHNVISPQTTRHCGSRDTLLSDFRKLARTNYFEEIEIRAAQLAHDLLVFVMLNKAGFYNRRPHNL